MTFDNTLSIGASWPNIGKPNLPLFRALLDEQHRGNKIILWTCREKDSYLQEAIDFCQKHGLVFDAINENLPDIGFYSRKIVADVYIDDLGIEPYSWLWNRHHNFVLTNQ